MENVIESFTQGSDSFLSKLQDFQFFLYTYSLKVHCLGASRLTREGWRFRHRLLQELDDFLEEEDCLPDGGGGHLEEDWLPDGGGGHLEEGWRPDGGGDHLEEDWQPDSDGGYLEEDS